MTPVQWFLGILLIAFIVCLLFTMKHAMVQPEKAKLGCVVTFILLGLFLFGVMCFPQA